VLLEVLDLRGAEVQGRLSVEPEEKAKPLRRVKKKKKKKNQRGTNLPLDNLPVKRSAWESQGTLYVGEPGARVMPGGDFLNHAAQRFRRK